jgi:hypothetical protein
MTLWFHSLTKAMTLDLGGTNDTATRLSAKPRGRRGGYGSA